MESNSLAAWLKRLEQLHPVAIELGLERVGTVADRLQCRHFNAPVVTVAGTNGKGSTIAVLEALAMSGELAVGAYTSPHLLAYNERIRLNGQPCADEAITAAFAAIDRARAGISLTYFEFGTLAALYLFQQQPLDLVILEVGLGGRLDAVNIVDPDIAVITSIALDHQDWLGNDRNRIAEEKAGVLRAGIPVVVADPDPPATLLRRATQLGCQVIRVNAELASSQPPSVLRGENIAAAAGVAGQLNLAISRAQLSTCLDNLSFPGRLQRCHFKSLPLVLDVAHNEAAVTNLVRFLRDSQVESPPALFAALSDKDIHAMIRACDGFFSQWHVVNLPAVGRALPASELASILNEQGESVAGVHSDPAAALEFLAQQPGRHKPLVVFGSFFTVAAVLRLLEQEARA